MKNLTAAAALASQVDKKTVANVGKVLVAIALYLLLRSSARKRLAQNEYDKVVAGNGERSTPPI
ncbi:hypothetical protein [Salmonirosea aquatica]|uniref:Uncharacterized protein n=1 Tax=Salmonirosea aquatica TaxID=2654236 RepID=A0A7C9BNZ2_9BACT|nr:hypothetical protein [Cytophagaceae bacterium SJW1-29]